MSKVLALSLKVINMATYEQPVPKYFPFYVSNNKAEFMSEKVETKTITIVTDLVKHVKLQTGSN